MGLGRQKAPFVHSSGRCHVVLGHKRTWRGQIAMLCVGDLSVVEFVVEADAIGGFAPSWSRLRVRFLIAGGMLLRVNVPV